MSRQPPRQAMPRQRRIVAICLPGSDRSSSNSRGDSNRSSSSNSRGDSSCGAVDLQSIAEAVFRFGTLVSVSSQEHAVWLEVTGVAHLFGGEERLLEEIIASIALLELGPTVRLGMAGGPWLSLAVARGASAQAALHQTALHQTALHQTALHQTALHHDIVLPERAAEVARHLPLSAIAARPFDLTPKRLAWFARLGVHTLGHLLELPRRSLGTRLGPKTSALLELAAGRDEAPLVPFEFSRSLFLETHWDDALVGVEPLLFVLHGLLSQLATRLDGRGEASGHLELVLEHDSAIAAQRGVRSREDLVFEFATPLHRPSDLERVLRSRLERTELLAPVVGVQLTASQLSPVQQVQLDLARRGDRRAPADLAVLLAELSGDVGATNLGVLKLADSHLPERQGELTPAEITLSGSSVSSTRPKAAASLRPSAKTSRAHFPLERATRLLSPPVPLEGPVVLGASFMLGKHRYTVERLRFAQRLEDLHWWTATSACRDYLWAKLRGPTASIEALIFTDRGSQQSFLQALVD